MQHEKGKENCYRPESVNKFLSNNYIEYESKGDKKKTLSAEEYLNEIRAFLKNIINNPISNSK